MKKEYLHDENLSPGIRNHRKHLGAKSEADGHGARLESLTKEFPNFYASDLASVDQAEMIFIIVADPPAVESVLNQFPPKPGAEAW